MPLTAVQCDSLLVGVRQIVSSEKMYSPQRCRFGVVCSLVNQFPCAHRGAVVRPRHRRPAAADPGPDAPRGHGQQHQARPRERRPQVAHDGRHPASSRLLCDFINMYTTGRVLSIGDGIARVYGESIHGLLGGRHAGTGMTRLCVRQCAGQTLSLARAHGRQQTVGPRGTAVLIGC